MTFQKPVQNNEGKWEVKISTIFANEFVIDFDDLAKANDFIIKEAAHQSSADVSELSQGQQVFVLAFWDKVRLDRLVQETFNDQTIDGRSKKGRLVKKFLTDRKAVPKPGYLQRLPDVELTDANKEYIKLNASTLSSLEMACALFPDRNVVQLSKEHRAVDAYVKTLDVSFFGEKGLPQSVILNPYDPPKSIDGTIKRFNKFSHVQLEKDKLATVQKKGLEALTSSLNSPRFIRTINAFSDEQDRLSFESEFIRHTWDKTDLTAEEINLYINLCSDYVMMFKIQAQIDALDQRMKQVFSDPNGEVTIRLTEAISVKTKEYDDCFNRHRKLADDLIGKRSKRLDKSIRDNASVLNLVQAWRNEEDRKRMILMAQAKEAEVTKEIQRLESLDEMKVRILGIGVLEATHGT